MPVKRNVQEKAKKPEEKKTPVRVTRARTVSLVTMGNTVESVMKLNGVLNELKTQMRDKVDYGVIPGTGNKPTLLKPGAEKILRLFGIHPIYDVTLRDLGDGHREYEILCRLEHPKAGEVGQGLGLCSTMESKFRYRKESAYDILEETPKDFFNNKEKYKKLKQGAKKINGQWEFVQYKDGEKKDNPNIWDTHNTVLKMSKKRALVDAILTVSGVSEMFTQDVEDIKNNTEMHDNYKTETPANFKPVEKAKTPAQNQTPLKQKPATEVKRAEVVNLTQEQEAANLSIADKLTECFPATDKEAEMFIESAKTKAPDLFLAKAKTWARGKTFQVIKEDPVRGAEYEAIFQTMDINERGFWNLDFNEILEALESLNFNGGQ